MNRPVAFVLGLGLTILVLLAIFVFNVFAERYRMPSESMLPTIEPGEILTVDQGAYDDADPERADVVTFLPPLGAEGAARQCAAPPGPGEACAEAVPGALGSEFLQRVIALPGEEFAMEDGTVLIDGEPLEEDYIAPCEGRRASCNFSSPIEIPDGTVYVLGDNRGASDDSRFWGPLPIDQLTGKVDVD